jgi:hypothetical protein
MINGHTAKYSYIKSSAKNHKREQEIYITRGGPFVRFNGKKTGNQFFG